MAKAQLSENAMDLVLAVGPTNAGFKAFIEGVRLVTGEQTLIGLPSSNALLIGSSVVTSPFVLTLHSPSMKFTLASCYAQTDDALFVSTSLLTQFRQKRRIEHQNFDSRNILAFGKTQIDNAIPLAYSLSADAGLESCVSGALLNTKETAPFVCQNHALDSGIVAIEALAASPWGVGMVSTGPFTDKPNIHAEAIKIAFKDALAQIGTHSALLSFLFLDIPTGDSSFPSSAVLLEIVRSSIKNIPILVFPTTAQFGRCRDRALKIELNTVMALVVPQ